MTLLKVYLLGCVFSYMSFAATFQNYWIEKDDTETHPKYYRIFYIFVTRIFSLFLSSSSWIGFLVGFIMNAGRKYKLFI